MRQLAAGGTAVSADASADLRLLSAGPAAEADPLAVGVELLALVSSLQADAVVLVIEDLQWINVRSARALLFALRRLSADRVLVILVAGRRDRPSRLRLGTVCGRRPPGFRSHPGRVGRRRDRSPLPGARPGRALPPERTEPARPDGRQPPARPRTAELSDDALNVEEDHHFACRHPARSPRSSGSDWRLSPRPSFVAAAAVLGDHCTLSDATAVACAADSAAVLGESERAGLLLERQAPSGWRLGFAHLLVRQAVYQNLGADQRRALHLRAAAVVALDEALAHRSAAAVARTPASPAILTKRQQRRPRSAT